MPPAINNDQSRADQTGSDSYERQLFNRSIQPDTSTASPTDNRAEQEAQQRQEYLQQVNQDRQAKARQEQSRANSEKNALKTAANLAGQPALAAAANIIPPGVFQLWKKILLVSAIFGLFINFLVYGGILVGLGTVVVIPQVSFCAAFGWAINVTPSTICKTPTKQAATSGPSGATTTTTTPTQTGGATAEQPKPIPAD